MAALFVDRRDAGRRLAPKLKHYAGRPDVIVLALPRGGVPVASEVAAALRVPLDILLVRKLGVPGHDELAMGAIASGGVRVLNHEVIQRLAIAPRVLEIVARREQREMERREQEYRQGRPAPDVRGRVVILVDDGLATGSSMSAAVTALRRQKANGIVAAVPVGASHTCLDLSSHVDEMICLEMPEDFGAVGEWYDDFGQVSGAEVRELLASSQPAARR